MRGIILVLVATLLAGCSTYEVTPITNRSLGHSGRVDVLYAEPHRPYESVGIVSAKRYKPGWTDPTVADAVPQLRAAGAEVGADAVIVRSTRTLNDRHIVVEGEAIRYLDR